MKGKRLTQVIKIGIFSLIAVIFLSYVFFETKDAILGVDFSVNGIAGGETFRESEVNIKGNAQKTITLALNGREIFIDREGGFNEKLFLLPGHNIITMRSKDRFGKTKEKSFNVIYKL